MTLPVFVAKSAISCMEYIKDSHIIDEDPKFAKKLRAITTHQNKTHEERKEEAKKLLEELIDEKFKGDDKKIADAKANAEKRVQLLSGNINYLYKRLEEPDVKPLTATAVKKIVALVSGHDDNVPIAASLLEMLKALKDLDVVEINKIDNDYKKNSKKMHEEL